MASYRKAPEVERDLIDIWRSISKDSKSAATKFIARLHSQMNHLATQPGGDGLGPSSDGGQHQAAECRVLRCEHEPDPDDSH